MHYNEACMGHTSLLRQLTLGLLLALGVTIGLGVELSERALYDRLVQWRAQDARAAVLALAATLPANVPHRTLASLSNQLDWQVAVLALDGRVMADSEIGERRRSTHLSTLEVDAAVRNGWGYAVRRSEPSGSEYLYVAVRDVPSNRIVHVAIPLRTLQQHLAALRAGLLLSLIFAGLVATMFVALMGRRLHHETRALLRAAQERGAGIRTPVPETSVREFAALTRALGSMTEQIDARVDELEAERTRLRAILDSMTEGVILCDLTGTITLVNHAFLQVAGITIDPRGHKLVELIREPEVLQAAERAQAGEVQNIAFQRGERFYQATFVPLTNTRVRGYVAVFHDVTALQHADRVRRDFVANVSHELRTPLASITGYTETLLDGAIDDPQVARQFVERIERNAERLTNLIDDLLDLARIESGRYELHIEPINAADAVDSAAQIVTRLVSKQHHFENLVPRNFLVWADRKALNQILVNLLDNAAKYSQPGSHIWVTAERQDGQTTLLVSDNGPGIPPQDLPRIFERFYRGDKSRNAAGEPGTGLGLAICKHLMAGMGGTIAAESSGRGTTIRVSFPDRASSHGTNPP